MILEQAKVMGLEALRDGPLRFFDVEGDDLRLIGVGYAVAKGWAVYSGSGVFEINIKGKAALAVPRVARCWTRLAALGPRGLSLTALAAMRF